MYYKYQDKFFFYVEIFAKLQRNELFEVSPAEIHFAGFEVNNDNRKYVQILRLINISGQVQRMTVLPPQTKFFQIIYVKQVLKFSLRFKIY